jgi:hypothetical protein
VWQLLVQLAQLVELARLQVQRAEMQQVQNSELVQILAPVEFHLLVHQLQVLWLLMCLPLTLLDLELLASMS